MPSLYVRKNFPAWLSPDSMATAQINTRICFHCASAESLMHLYACMWTISQPLRRGRCKRSNLWTRGQGLSAGQTAKETRFEDIGGWLILKLDIWGRKKCAFQLQLHTYMNDVRIGVLVVAANKKVNQKLSSIFLIQLGDGILQPPRLAWRSEKLRELRKSILLCI